VHFWDKIYFIALSPRSFHIVVAIHLKFRRRQTQREWIIAFSGKKQNWHCDIIYCKNSSFFLQKKTLASCFILRQVSVIDLRELLRIINCIFVNCELKIVLFSIEFNMFCFLPLILNFSCVTKCVKLLNVCQWRKEKNFHAFLCNNLISSHSKSKEANQFAH
jgi:hypothetical protein